MEESINKLLEATSKILAEHQSGKFFNCVDICGVGEIETRHTGIIAALLDPRGNHGFGAESLKAFFRQCGLPEFANDCDDCYVQTEVQIPGRRPDIVIQGRNLCVVIENKTNTSDHYMQLADYRVWLEKQRVMNKKLLYLTYGGYSASDTNIAPEEYQRISYRETICNWLLACAHLAKSTAANFCLQYADFIQKILIPEGIMNKNITEKILENIDSFKAANCINKSFDNARFQKIANIVRECWDGTEEIHADNFAVGIDFLEKSYRIAFQYNNGTPYFGLARKEEKSNYVPFKLEEWRDANEWWLAWKYVNKKEFNRNWSDAEFLAEQWSKDNFESFKRFIKELLNNVKTVLESDSERIDVYSSEK